MNQLALTPSSVLLLIALSWLSGCSEGGIGGTGGEVLLPAAVAAEPALAPAGSSEAYTQYMQDSLALWGGLADDSESFEVAIGSPFPARAVAAPEAAQGDSFNPVQISDDATLTTDNFQNVTGTNLIVGGVDELDAAKYNGENIFLANNSRLTVLAANGDGVPETIANLSLNSEDLNARIKGMYLYESDTAQVLAAIRGSNFLFFDAISILPYFNNNQTVIDLVNVSTPSAPIATSRIRIEGNLIDSRRIGQHLILITRFSPQIDGFQTFATDEKARDTNESALAELTSADLTPTYTQDGLEQSLVDPSTCLLPNEGNVAPEFPTLTTISAIDLETQTLSFATCLADGVIGVHMTQEALYVASPARNDANDYYAETAIHRFSQTNGRFDYDGSGVLPGSFWGDPKFLMGEVDGRLAAITTESGTGDVRFSHRLSVLAPAAADPVLELVGQIPNDNRPETIGKPNEQIFASRFFGDKAYVVTFEQIDPVYAIDLSDPTDPMITGELEIPGFSSYLHPISDTLMLGIGSNTRTQDGRIVNDGVNVRLFDVGTPGDVTLLDEESFGGQWSYTPVAFDHHAFSLQQQSEQEIRFALPITRYDSLQNSNTTDERTSPTWTDTALQLLSVDFRDNSPQLELHDQITAEDQTTGERYQSGCCGWQTRSFFNNDSVLYLNKNRVFQATWDTPDIASNTFIQTLFSEQDTNDCPTRAPDPLSVSLFDQATGEYLNCGFTSLSDSDDEPVPAEDLLFAPECIEPEISTQPEIAGPGSYSVTVALEGYLPLTVNDVRIQANQCHVATTHLGLYLLQ